MIWKPVIAGAALLAAAGSGAGLWWNWPRQSREMRLPGTVETQEVRLSSRVGGRVAKIFVEEAQLIEAGQKILELAMPELDAQRAQLVAQKEAAKAVLAKLEKGSREEEKAAAKAAVEAAQARLDRMTKGYRTEEKDQARNELLAFDAQVQNALSKRPRSNDTTPPSRSTTAWWLSKPRPPPSCGCWKRAIATKKWPKPGRICTGSRPITT
jgi:multidrug efflux pump subunit AcrA (membrane-fusion protein)